MEKEEKKKREQGRLVIDGNAFYEIDVNCMERKKKKQQHFGQKKRRQRN